MTTQDQGTDAHLSALSEKWGLMPTAILLGLFCSFFPCTELRYRPSLRNQQQVSAPGLLVGDAAGLGSIQLLGLPFGVCGSQWSSEGLTAFQAKSLPWRLLEKDKLSVSSCGSIQISSRWGFEWCCWIVPPGWDELPYSSLPFLPHSELLGSLKSYSQWRLHWPSWRQKYLGEYRPGPD